MTVVVIAPHSNEDGVLIYVNWENDVFCQCIQHGGITHSVKYSRN